MRTRALIASFLVFGTIACATTAPATPQPPRSVQAQVAIYGDRVVNAANLALTGLDGLMSTTPPIVSRDAGLTIIRAIDVLSGKAIQLADVLKAIDEATDATKRQDQIAIARALVSGMQRAVDDSLLPITDPAQKARVSGVLDSLRAVLGTLSATLGLQP